MQDEFTSVSCSSVGYASKIQFDILPVSQSIICPAIVVCYRSWLTERSLSVVFQVPLVIGSTCKCQLLLSPGVRSLIFFVAFGYCELPVFSLLSRITYELCILDLSIKVYV